MRGRLINPFKLELHQLDTVATAADPDAAGLETSGYDPDFREPIRLPDGSSATKYKDPILLPVQVEVTTYEQLQQQAAGNDSATSLAFVFHFRDLEEAGLVDDNGNPMIRIGDKATAIYHYRDETLIMKLGLDGQGVFCTEAQPRSFGLSGGARNLLVGFFSDRQKTYRGG